MTEAVCRHCRTYLAEPLAVCPVCASPLIYIGEDQSVIRTLPADCLVHRYRGSDLLEPAAILSEGRTNIKIATRLADYNRPLTAPKRETYVLDRALLSQINDLRAERRRAVEAYDEKIAACWQHLTPYYEEATYDPHAARSISSPTVTNK